MPWCSARPGTIASLVRASGTASGRPVAMHARGAGRAVSRSAGTRPARSAAVAGAGPSWLISSSADLVGGEQGLQAASSAARSASGRGRLRRPHGRGGASGRFSSARMSVAVRRGLCLPEWELAR